MGGGVSANMELRKRLRSLGKEYNTRNVTIGEFMSAFNNVEEVLNLLWGWTIEDKIDRNPNAKISD